MPSFVSIYYRHLNIHLYSLCFYSIRFSAIIRGISGNLVFIHQVKPATNCNSRVTCPPLLARIVSNRSPKRLPTNPNIDYTLSFDGDSSICVRELESHNGDAQVKGDQNARAKGDHFELKNSVRVGRLSTDIATTRSVQFFSCVFFPPSFGCRFLLLFNR